jgi:hypothetical protein
MTDLDLGGLRIRIHNIALFTLLHLSNPSHMGRSFVVARVGLNNLPASTAFFSSVDVDTVLRKEPGKKTFANVVFYFEISQLQIGLILILPLKKLSYEDLIRMRRNQF